MWIHCLSNLSYSVSEVTYSEIFLCQRDKIRSKHTSLCRKLSMLYLFSNNTNFQHGLIYFAILPKKKKKEEPPI